MRPGTAPPQTIKKMLSAFQFHTLELLLRFCLQKNFYTKKRSRNPSRAEVDVHFRRAVRAPMASHAQPGPGEEPSQKRAVALACVPSVVQGGNVDASLLLRKRWEEGVAASKPEIMLPPAPASAPVAVNLISDWPCPGRAHSIPTL